MAVHIEARAYGPDSTPEEVAAIKDRIYFHSEGVVMYRETPVQSVFQLDLFEEKLNELAATVDAYRLIIDLTEAGPPDAEIRAKLKKVFTGQAKLRAVAAFTGKNFMLNVAAKFVLGSLGPRSFTVHKTLEEALEAVRS